MKRILYVLGDDRYGKTHRLALMTAAVKAGYDVHLACPPGPFLSLFEEAQITVHPLSYFRRGGTRPLWELKTLWELGRVYWRLRPHIVHHAALKPNLYGTFLGRVLRVPLMVNTFGGMGYLFTHGGRKAAWIRRVLLIILRAVLKHKRVHVTVQNQDDFALSAFFTHGGNHHLIQGSGVDLQAFPLTPLPPIDDGRGPIGLFAGRFLKDKGVMELAAAARLLRERGVPVQLIWAGDVDGANPSSLHEEDVKALEKQGFITLAGLVDHMAPLYQGCHFVVLPSYREGLPKTLLEAAATGRPLVTTDVPGCREMIDLAPSGLPNGILVPPRDSHALAQGICDLIHDPQTMAAMGLTSRTLAESRWDQNLIIRQSLDIYGHDGPSDRWPKSGKTPFVGEILSCFLGAASLLVHHSKFDPRSVKILRCCFCEELECVCVPRPFG